MRIVHIASEAVPAAKTGGLADVVGALSRALADLGHRVTVILPLYRLGPQDPESAEPVSPAVTAGAFRFRVWRRPVGPVEYLLLDAPRLFARAGLYGTPDGDFPDNPIRFAAFTRAALLAARTVGSGADVLHCHDWQTALAPLLGRHDPAVATHGPAAPVVLTIHNLAYQGSFPAWAAAAADLPPGGFTPDGYEFFGTVNFLKGGILAADRLTTVSPTYAREILTPRHGCGLEGVLAARADRLTGILNGLDTTAWNPATDPHLPRRYTRRDVSAGKRACRDAVAAELGLDRDRSPLAGVVSRLAAQKGVDLLAAAVDRIVAAGFRLAVLGRGDEALEQAVAAACRRHPGRAAARIGFDEGLAHRIYAASDLFLMPSRYEPCGLGQLIALAYGALPVVNPTGGLADTVRDLDDDPDRGNGFHLPALTAGALAATLERAAALLRRPADLLAVRRRAMAEDHSWGEPARRYEAVYRDLAAP